MPEVSLWPVETVVAGATFIPGGIGRILIRTGSLLTRLAPIPKLGWVAAGVGVTLTGIGLLVGGDEEKSPDEILQEELERCNQACKAGHNAMHDYCNWWYENYYPLSEELLRWYALCKQMADQLPRTEEECLRFCTNSFQPKKFTYRPY
jgi:hypothetical protein